MEGARIVIADDHALMCEGLRGMLEPPHEVVDVVHDGRDVIGVLDHHHPEIVLLDISLPGRTGMELLREIRERLPETLVVMLTMHTERVYADEAIAAGASGYVLKSSGAVELRFAIDEVRAGRRYVTPLLPIATGGIAAVGPPPAAPELHGGDEDGDGGEGTHPSLAPGRPRALYASLTLRQKQVLQLLAEGKSTAEIGEKLGISMKTVEFHRHGIRRELGLTSHSALVRFAVAAGLVVP